MGHNLNYEGSDCGRGLYNDLEYDNYKGIGEGDPQISHSIQRVNIENTRNFGVQQLDCENSSGFARNSDLNSRSYEPVSLAGMYLDPVDSNSIQTLRRSSMRGRRRYRRTLLRNYEQPLGQCSQINQLYLEKCEDSTIHLQRRSCLKSTNMGVGGGMNYSSFKFNNNFDSCTKTSKPSWDGGRLVKLLQGHGLNIDHYEKENEHFSSTSWSSKQLNHQNGTFGSNIIEGNISKSVNEQKYTQLSVNQGICTKGSDDSNKQNVIVVSDLTNSSLCTSQHRDNIKSYNNTILSNEITHLCQIGNLENQESIQEHPGAYKNVSGKHLEQPNKCILPIISSTNNQHLMEPNMNLDTDHLVCIAEKKSSSNTSVNCKELHFDSERKCTITCNVPNIEKHVVNIECGHIFNMEEHEGGRDSHLIYNNFNQSFDIISQEELLVTLGDTPTSKSCYNLSSLFVPNQDS
ncbi:hypothetical protein OJ253_3112 [Cryptosporidium canis]|uniref:Uncharacterized protein n=1 Tax=Cryptosporidium canis TaxID=195482 RepID=A0A9D5DJB0_9CRYT|nr:hypothetical protein OJ253_3112 [Cryptosporidium canis]